MISSGYFVTEKNANGTWTNWHVSNIDGRRHCIYPQAQSIQHALYLVHYLQLPMGCFGLDAWPTQTATSLREEEPSA